jgi:tetratricopeptide (TPR) repeat protein
VPKDAEEKIYQLKVKAVDEIESNEETIAFIVGAELKSLANLVRLEMERLEAIANNTFLLNCLDLGDNSILFHEAKRISELGISELELGNYRSAIDLFEYSSNIYEKIIKISDTLMYLKLTQTNPFTFPPFTENAISNIKTLTYYAQIKNYKEFCSTLRNIWKYSLYSKIVAGALGLFSLLSVILLINAYRTRKKVEILGRLKRIRERLKKIMGGEEVKESD